MELDAPIGGNILVLDTPDVWTLPSDLHLRGRVNKTNPLLPRRISRARFSICVFYISVSLHFVRSCTSFFGNISFPPFCCGILFGILFAISSIRCVRATLCGHLFMLSAPRSLIFTRKVAGCVSYKSSYTRGSSLTKGASGRNARAGVGFPFQQVGSVPLRLRLIFPPWLHHRESENNSGTLAPSFAHAWLGGAVRRRRFQLYDSIAWL